MYRWYSLSLSLSLAEEGLHNAGVKGEGLVRVLSDHIALEELGELVWGQQLFRSVCSQSTRLEESVEEGMVLWEVEAIEGGVGIDVKQLAVLRVAGVVGIVVAVVVEPDETPASDFRNRVDGPLFGNPVAMQIVKGLLVRDVTNLDDLLS